MRNCSYLKAQIYISPFDKAIDSWIESDNEIRHERADRILQIFEKKHLVDMSCYHNVMGAISAMAVGKKASKASGLDGVQLKVMQQYADMIEQIMRRMERLSFDNAEQKPSVTTYNFCMNAYSMCGDGARAEKLLSDMRERDIEPDINSYNSAIASWARSDHEGSATKAEAILDAMKDHLVEPNDISFTEVIFAYTRSRDSNSVDKALQLVERMEKNGLSCNEFVYNAVLNSLAKSRQNDNVEKAHTLLEKMIRTDVASNISFNSVLNCHAKCSDPESGSSAKALLERMESSHNFKPDVISYTSVIDALTRSRDWNAPENASEILEKMLKLANDGDLSVQPNAITYNTVINTWASSGKPNSAKKAEELLKRMETIYESGECKKVRPNTISYTSVIDAYARTKSENGAINAERIFKQMEKKYNGGNDLAKPNVHSFNAGKSMGFRRMYIVRNASYSFLFPMHALMKLLMHGFKANNQAVHYVQNKYYLRC